MSQLVSVVQPASTLQVASTVQLASGGQGSFTRRGAGAISSDVPSYNWFGPGAGAITSNVPSNNWLGFGGGAATSGASCNNWLGFAGGAASFGSPSNTFLPGASSSGLLTATTSTWAYNRPSSRLTLIVPPSPSKASATRMNQSQTSPFALPPTGSRLVSMCSPEGSPMPHYSPVSPLLVGQRAGSVSRIQ